MHIIQSVFDVRIIFYTYNILYVLFINSIIRSFFIFDRSYIQFLITLFSKYFYYCFKISCFLNRHIISYIIEKGRCIVEMKLDILKFWKLLYNGYVALTLWLLRACMCAWRKLSMQTMDANACLVKALVVYYMEKVFSLQGLYLRIAWYCPKRFNLKQYAFKRLKWIIYSVIINNEKSMSWTFVFLVFW